MRAFCRRSDWHGQCTTRSCQRPTAAAHVRSRRGCFGVAVSGPGLWRAQPPQCAGVHLSGRLHNLLLMGPAVNVRVFTGQGVQQPNDGCRGLCFFVVTESSRDSEIRKPESPHDPFRKTSERPARWIAPPLLPALERAVVGAVLRWNARPTGATLGGAGVSWSFRCSPRCAWSPTAPYRGR